MIVMIILILLACLFAGSIESNLSEAFSNPDWLSFEEGPTCDDRQRLDMENTEFDYGHNISRNEDDYE